MAATDVKFLGCIGTTKDGNGRHRTYDTAYHVKCDSVFDEPNTFDTHPDLPVLLSSTYGTDGRALAVSYSAKQVKVLKDGILWELTFKYDSQPPTPDKQVENPLDKPQVISIGGVKMSEYIGFDLDGFALVNSAFEPPEAPLEDPRTLRIINISKNVSNDVYLSLMASDLEDTINDADVTIGGISYQKWSLKVDDLTFQERFDPVAEVYWETQIKLVRYKKVVLVNDVPVTYLWHPFKLLDQGFNELNLDTFELEAIQDKRGQPVQKPRPLDGFGQELSKTETEAGNFIFRDFRIREEADWGTLLA